MFFRLEIRVLPGMSPQTFDIKANPETLEIQIGEHGYYINIIDSSDQPRAWFACQLIHVSFWEIGEDVTPQSDEERRELPAIAQPA